MEKNNHRESKRLLFFSHTAELGGAEKSMLYLIEHLLSCGYTILVVLPYHGELEKYLKLLGLPFVYCRFSWWCSVGAVSKLEKIQRIVRSIWEVWILFIVTFNYKPDLVLSNTITTPWGMLYSQLARRPHLMLLREFGTLDFGFDFFLGYQNSLKLINKYSKIIYTNSKTTKKYFKSYIDPQKMLMLYPFVSETDEALEMPKHHYFKNTDSLKLAVLGSLLEAKGQLDAVKAIVLLFQKNMTKLELILVGKKQSSEYLEKIFTELESDRLVKNVIQVIDFVEYPLDIIRQADVVLVCSRHEAFGRVTAEAMALKKPVIASNAGANKELVINEKTGLLYEVGNPVELATKIEYFYHHRSELQKFGQAGFDQYTNKLQPKMNVDGFAKSVAELTS